VLDRKWHVLDRKFGPKKALTHVLDRKKQGYSCVLDRKWTRRQGGWFSVTDRYNGCYTFTMKHMACFQQLSIFLR
jgi:hypothetical protein